MVFLSFGFAFNRLRLIGLLLALPLGVNPVSIIISLCLFTIFGNDFKLVNENLIRIEAIFIDKHESIILNLSCSTS